MPAPLPPSAINPKPTTAPTDEPLDPRLLAVMDEATTEIDAERTAEVQAQTQDRGALGQAADVVDALGGGIAKGIYETKDFLVGEPDYADKSAFRRADEAYIADLERRSALNSVARNVGQFVLGLVGTGKLKAAKDAPAAAKFAVETLRGAAIGATVFDPQEDRLSNLVQEFPSLDNPVTAYLAADPGDGDAEGRLKNALEGIGMDLALAGVFALGVKAMKLRRMGRADEAAKVADEATAALDAYHSGIAKPAQGVWDGAKLGPEGPAAAPASGSLSPSALPPSSSSAAPRLAPGDSGKPADAKAGPDGAMAPAPTKAAPESSLSPPKPVTSDEAERLVKLSDMQQHIGTYGDPQEFRGMPPGGYVNWTKIGGAADVQAYTAAVTQALEPRLKAIAGDVISDGHVRKMVAARAAAFDEDPTALIASIRRQGESAKAHAADMEAAYVVANGLFQDVHQLASRIKFGLLDEFGGDRAKAVAELGRRAALAADVMGSARSMTAAAGRTLRRMRNEFKITPEMLADLEGNKGAALVEALYQSGGDPKLMAKALNPSLWQRGEQAFAHLIVNGPLWWYPTHVINGLGNLYMLAARPTERLLGSMFLGGEGQAIRRQALKEYRYQMSAIADGWNAAKQAFMEGDSRLAGDNPFMEGLPAANAIKLRPIGNVDDLVFNALQFAKPKTLTGYPTRFLGAADELVKTIRYRAVIQARAAAEAEGLGLAGADAEAHIARSLSAAFDDAGRAVDRQALLEAQAATLSTPLRHDTLGYRLQNAVQAQPLLRAVFTYVRTPINALRYGIRMTPGLQFAQREMREMLTSKDPMVRAQAYGQMTLGALWIGAAYPAVSSGMVTGGGPSDPKLRAELTAQGWKPYSIVWTREDGSKVYVPLGRLDPPGLLLGMMADAHQLLQHPETSEAGNNILAAMSIALMKNVMNKTYLTSLDQAVRALRDPEVSLVRWGGNVVESTIPFSALLRGSNPDEYAREARSFADHILDSMPGYSASLEPRFDALGDPVTVQRGLWSHGKGDDVVRDELQRIILETGKGLTPVTPSRESGVDLRDFKLKDGRSAYAALNEMIARPKGARPLHDTLATMMQGKPYAAAPDGDAGTKGTKLWLIASMVQRYREAAYKRLLAENADLREAIYSTRRKAKAAYQENRKAQMQQDRNDDVGRALDALGVR